MALLPFLGKLWKQQKPCAVIGLQFVGFDPKRCAVCQESGIDIGMKEAVPKLMGAGNQPGSRLQGFIDVDGFDPIGPGIVTPQRAQRLSENADVHAAGQKIGIPCIVMLDESLKFTVYFLIIGLHSGTSYN